MVWLYVVEALIFLAIIGSFLKHSIIRRVSWSLLLLAALTIAAAFSVVFLGDLLGPAGVWLPWVVGGGLFFLLLLLLWKPFARKTRRIAALSLAGAVLVLTATVVGIRLYENSIPEARREEEIDLSKYEPFRQGTLARSLDEASTLTLTQDLPRLDGATALYPLYSSFARAVYPADDYYVYGDLRGKDEKGALGQETVICSRTSYAFENLIMGYADVVFLMGVSDEQRQMAQAAGVELTLTPIGREAFVFFVNERNPVSGLSVEQIKAIYSGQITNWREVGGKSDAIAAYQRPENSGSQTALLEIMENVPLMPAPEKDVFSAMMGMYRAVADYKNYRNAFGYSFMFYINEMVAEGGVKLLFVDGVAPSNANITSGAYPFSNEFYAVTATLSNPTAEQKARAANAQKLIEWMLSPRGNPW